MNDLDSMPDKLQGLAASVRRPSLSFIDGKAVAAKSGLTFKSFNPATGQLLANIASCDVEDINAAVSAAHSAFSSKVWAGKSAGHRKTVMKRLAELIDANRDELAVLESLESGKPVSDCLLVDVPETARTIEWFGEGIDKLYDQISPANIIGAGLIVREPIGVVAAVLPWNFPLMMLAWKIGPALATGNSVIIKPAEQTSMTALRVAELAIEAGLPQGVLNVVPGEGEKAGRAIGLHPVIGAVSFTGSTEVGRLFLQYSAASNLKRITLECGGKNPSVVLSDANIEEAARHTAFAAFWNMGQNCTANSRVIVHRSIKDAFLQALIAETKKWSTGDPLNPNNMLGSLVSVEHLDQVRKHVAEAKREKAVVAFEGKIGKNDGGAFMAPMIFDEVTPNMKIARQEIFGPVTAIMVSDSDNHALALANDTDYGLQASLFTRDIRRAYSFARQINAGTVSINAYSEGDITTPFGGFKQSGFGGRDKSIFAYDQYLEKKTIWIGLDS